MVDYYKIQYNVRGVALPSLPQTPFSSVPEIRLWCLVNEVPYRYITVQGWGIALADLFAQTEILKEFTLQND